MIVLTYIKLHQSAMRYSPARWIMLFKKKRKAASLNFDLFNKISVLQ